MSADAIRWNVYRTLQKLAHRKNEERAQKRHDSNNADEADGEEDDSAPSMNGEDVDHPTSKRQYQKHNGHFKNVPSPIPEEDTPCPSPLSRQSQSQIQSQSPDGRQTVKALPVVLLHDTEHSSADQRHSNPRSRSRSPSPAPLLIPQSQSRFPPNHVKHVNLNSPISPIPNGHDTVTSENENESDNNAHEQDQEQGQGGQVKEGEYLKSKLWWLGQILITVGEGGNFLSYGFAPASVVAPLGTVALIANCIFAPLILREKFHKRELFGMALAIIGAITVVWSSNGSNPRLNPDQLISALKRIPFIVYTILTIVLLVTLILLSNSSYGHRYLLIDIGVCTLFGGYTVLSTKALSSLLSNDFFGSWNFGITWFLVIMVAGTSIGQVRWLNRALMNFQSKEVIPTQFVFFSMAAIIGSAVLYEEFKDVPFSSFVNFAFGIATTFLGVHLLTSTPSENTSGGDTDSIRSSRPTQPQRATSSASLNLLLPSSASLNGERAPLLISSPSNWQTSPNNMYTPGLGLGSTPTSTSTSNRVRLVRIGSNGEFSPALGIGSQAGLLLLATTPPGETLHRGRSASKSMTLGNTATSTAVNSASNAVLDEERGRPDGVGVDAGRKDRRGTSASRRQTRG
uniref:DUF803-domain-containing protein n=1 Tax=Kwoniella dejecticola CBS 10117 TaxID=1296121 RepID=A0A1A5ZWR9_9TREE|nr:uncharacterized protein I303_07008 [Kwoniella dejecticola CBS 10117]OBR82249.1 hypothetical protein I303_07008 [Kwoniella dejecticola CBS 10117]